MKNRFALYLCALLALAGLTLLASSVQASGAAQTVYATPTPGPDGRIIYIVQNGDNCESIAMLNGVSIDFLRTTNALDENCFLREGQRLLIGVGGPAAASPTPGPSPTPTTPQPTGTPEAGGVARVCVLVYEDLNGDALRQETEPALEGAALSLTNLDGSFSQTLLTVLQPDPEAYQGICFENVPFGKYNLSAAPPAGYNPTIRMASELEILPGDTAYLGYGAQLQTGEQDGGAGRGGSPLLGILGAIFLMGAIGLGIYAWRVMRKR